MDQMSELGGYQLITGAGLPPKNAFNFSSEDVHLFALGRHCLEAIYRSVQPRKVFLPQYTCHSVKFLFERLGAEAINYSLGEEFIPEIKTIDTSDLLVINNYFGLAASNACWLSWLKQLNHAQVVVDDTQSLCVTGQFHKHCSFISPRKFLPVTDGGILFTPSNTIDKSVLPTKDDKSWQRVQWLFRAVDEQGRQQSYVEYLQYRKQEIQNIPYSKMSEVTKFLLQTYDVKSLIEHRNRLFFGLRRLLPIHPLFKNVSLSPFASPIGFPVKVGNTGKVQSALAEKKIYAVRYWPELNNADNLSSIELELVTRTIFLPLDGEYSDAHISIILAQTVV